MLSIFYINSRKGKHRGGKKLKKFLPCLLHFKHHVTQALKTSRFLKPCFQHDPALEKTSSLTLNFRL